MLLISKQIPQSRQAFCFEMETLKVTMLFLAFIASLAVRIIHSVEDTGSQCNTRTDHNII